MRVLKIVLLTQHVFLECHRKASVHFVAREMAAAGHDVSFTSVGHSLLSKLKQGRRFAALCKTQKNRYVDVAPNLRAGAYIPPLHAFSTSNAVVNRAVQPLFMIYGSYLPRFVAERIREADLVVTESGTSLVFLRLVRRLNPKAKLLYFCRDLLQSVGAAPYLSRLERQLIGEFDSICVPSKRLGEMLPPGGKVNFVPQGIDVDIFDKVGSSPYQPGSLNAVAIGDMLFDQSVVERMAAAAPQVDFHLFGIRWNGEIAGNVKVHGEQSFETVASYVRHADIGLAPYKVKSDELYLAESSLKLMQYGYCLLPVVLPDVIPVSRGNEVTYAMDAENDWPAIMQKALGLSRQQSFRSGILTWEEVTRRTLATVFPN